MPLNNSANDSKCDNLSYDPAVFPVLYLLTFPIALLLNGVAAWVSVHLESTTTFIVYLKNLIGADLILTLAIPITAVSDLPSASQQLFVLSCRFFSVIFYSSFYTSITFLSLISLDRFAKIVTPQSKFGQNVMFSRVTSAAVWMIVFGLTALPTIILTNKESNDTQIKTCMDLKGPAGIYLHQQLNIILNVYFWFVTVVVAICYICITNKVIQSFRNSGSNNSKGKQKIKLRVFLVLLVFFASFGPFHIVRIPYTFQQVNSSVYTGCAYAWSKFAKELTLWLATTNICLDPLLYVFLCREFNEKLVSLMSQLSLLFHKLLMT